MYGILEFLRLSYGRPMLTYMQNSIAKEKNGVKNGWKKDHYRGDRRLMANVMKYFHVLKQPLPLLELELNLLLTTSYN